MCGVFMRRELCGNGLVLHDRSGDELREHGHIAAERYEASLCRYEVAADIDHIAHGLKGVEGNTDGKRDMRLRKPESEGGIQDLDQEIGVFEEAQQGEVEKEADCQQERREASPAERAGSFRSQPEKVIDCDGEQEKGYIKRFAPGIEKKTRQK